MTEQGPDRRMVILGPSGAGPMMGMPQTIGALAIVVVGTLLALAIMLWFWCRISVDPEHFVVLVKKDGKNLTNEMILAPDAEHKGVQHLVLGAGRHFRNPYVWNWDRQRKATQIPPGKVGIRIRKLGKPLPVGRVVAETAEEKGIVRHVLKPGRYNVNPYAYALEVLDAVRIDPGYAGVITLPQCFKFLSALLERTGITDPDDQRP